NNSRNRLMTTMMERLAKAKAKSAAGIIEERPGLDATLREQAVAELERRKERLQREVESLKRTKSGLSDEIAATRAAANLDAGKTRSDANDYFLEKKAKADEMVSEAVALRTEA